MDPFLQSISERLQVVPRPQRVKRVLVAVSGGLDSVALLHALHQLQAALGWELVAAHFNHRLRDDESDADERWVARLSRRLGVRCVAGAGDVRGHAARQGVSIEMAARDLRHAFLADTAARERCQAIATAHHADDQVELFLLRAARGAGGEGLGGMTACGLFPRDPRLLLLRPLLPFTRQAIRAWARQHRIAHREDSSNASLDPLRNRVRLHVLPELVRQLGPASLDGIRRSMELVRSEAHAVATEAREWLRSTSPRRSFHRLSVGVQRRIVVEQLFEMGLAPEFLKVEALRTHPRSVVTFPGDVRVECARTGRIRRASRPFAERFGAGTSALDLTDAAGQVRVGDVCIRWKIGPAPSLGWIRRRKAGVEVFDAQAVGPHLQLRHWQPGDRFRPLGFKSPSKLQNILVNRKVPAARRRQLAVAVHPDGRLVWVEGLPPGHDFRVTARTRHCLILRSSLAPPHAP